MLSVVKKYILQFIFVALIASSTAFAQSGLEYGVFVPLGMGISIHQYDREYFKSDEEFEKYTTNSATRRRSSVGFEGGVLFNIGYRLALGKNLSMSFLGEIGYNRDVFSYSLEDSNTNSGVMRLKNYQVFSFDNLVIGVLPKFNFGKMSIGLGGGVKIPLYGYINSSSFNPVLGYVTDEISMIKATKLSDYFETPVIPYIKLVFDSSVYSAENFDLVLSGYINYDFAINYTNKTVADFGPKQSLSSIDLGIQLGAKIKPMSRKGRK